MGRPGHDTERREHRRETAQHTTTRAQRRVAAYALVGLALLGGLEDGDVEAIVGLEEDARLMIEATGAIEQVPDRRHHPGGVLGGDIDDIDGKGQRLVILREGGRAQEQAREHHGCREHRSPEEMHTSPSATITNKVHHRITLARVQHRMPLQGGTVLPRNAPIHTLSLTPTREL